MIKYNGKDIIPRLNGKELSRVMYNGKQIYPANNVVEIQLANVVAGDICVFDGTNKRFFRFVDSGATDDIKKYTPIGVVAVPTSHNVYGDGSCGVMSLKTMWYNKPDEGDYNHDSIYWGGYGTDIPQLPNLSEVCICNNGGAVTGTDTSGTLPSDKFGSGNQYDPETAYPATIFELVPSPYNAEGGRNPGYYQTSSPSSTANALADFDGIGNSEVLWNLSTAQSDWKTASTIINSYNSGYYPAACCCWRYHTEGTSQGDWYLPATGELGYAIVRQNKINETITNLQNIYDWRIAGLITNSYWSSSEADNNAGGNIYTYDNIIVGGDKKQNNNYARAFLRVK